MPIDRVYLIVPNPAIHSALKYALKRARFGTLGYHTGREALMVVPQIRPAVVVIGDDLEDAVGIGQAVRVIDQTIKIVVLGDSVNHDRWSSVNPEAYVRGAYADANRLIKALKPLIP